MVIHGTYGSDIFGARVRECRVVALVWCRVAEHCGVRCRKRLSRLEWSPGTAPPPLQHLHGSMTCPYPTWLSYYKGQMMAKNQGAPVVGIRMHTVLLALLLLYKMRALLPCQDTHGAQIWQAVQEGTIWRD